MKCSYVILLSLILLIGLGCSGGKNTPMTPGSDTGVNGEVPVSINTDFQILGSGTMNLDKGTVEPDERATDPYINVTSLLGSNFSFTINGIVPPDIIDITLRLNNPSTLTVYDVCIVFEELYGKTVTNPDSYMDIFQLWDIDPFIAFRKESPTRAFPPGVDTEKLYLKYPSGSTPNVKYFIIAHLGGNTGGVYEIRDWTTVGQLTPTGGSVDVKVKALDWQNDVQMVVADTTVLTGGVTQFAKTANQYEWGATITNSRNVGVGTYPIIVMAKSPANPVYQTYNKFSLEVTSGGTLTCNIVTNPSPSNVVQGDPINFDGSGSSGGSPIISYEWDFDYDGVTFDIDVSGAVVDYYVCKVGTSSAALRITDSTMASSICTVPVTVTSDTGSIGGWGVDRKIVDNTTGPFILNISHRAIRAYGNSLYVVFNSTVGDTWNIYFTKSDDMGATWSTPVMVTNYAIVGASAQYANLWVDGNTGDIYVRYDYDAATGLNDVYVVRSQDAGATWGTPVKVNPGTPNTANRWQGAIVIDDSVNPSRLYVSYYDESDSLNLAIFVATTTTANLSTWTNKAIDDNSLGALQPTIFVNPVDHSINCIWSDSLFYGGVGALMFDRSTNNGTTWGTDKTIYTISTDTGPYEPSMAIQPTTGIPGVLFRFADSVGGTCNHYFVKANDMAGNSWKTPIDVTGEAVGACWAGTLDVSGDGHWVAVWEEDPSLWYAMFSQSLNDGTTWSPAINVDDSGAIWNVSMAMDECKDVHVVWADYQTSTYELYYDMGS